MHQTTHLAWQPKYDLKITKNKMLQYKLKIMKLIFIYALAFNMQRKITVFQWHLSQIRIWEVVKFDTEGCILWWQFIWQNWKITPKKILFFFLAVLLLRKHVHCQETKLDDKSVDLKWSLPVNATTIMDHFWIQEEIYVYLHWPFSFAMVFPQTQQFSGCLANTAFSLVPLLCFPAFTSIHFIMKISK